MEPSIDSNLHHNKINEETVNVFRIINTFKNYGKVSLKKIEEKISFLANLPKNHQDMLVKYKESLEYQLKCIEINEEIMKRIADDVNIFENEFFDIEQEILKEKSVDLSPRSHFHEKIHCILKQIAREWSSEGEEERNECFNPILNEIEERFKGCKHSEIKILVPGSGLARLPFEIARRGFACQGNEYSLFMLFSSNFILNKCTESMMFTIYPWVHTSVNNYTVYNQIRSVQFPDISPTECIQNDDFSMVGGNFIEVYNTLNSWNCVCTCFFLDTAQNVLDYIEKIYCILKPGGIWINMGPLLYHYADSQNSSIEPSYDVLKSCIESFGFKFLKEKLKIPMHYTQNRTSMLVYKYKSVFFVCQK